MTKLNKIYLSSDLRKQRQLKWKTHLIVIKHTGTFDEVDRLYGDIDAAKNGGSSESGGDDSEGGDGGDFSGGGGGGFGGGGLDFGDEGGDDADFGDDEGDAGDDAGGDDEGLDFGGDEGGDSEATEESFKNINNLLTETKLKHKKKIKKHSDNYFDKLLKSVKKDSDKIINERVKVVDKSIRVNETINDMIGGIDKMINE